MDYYSALLMPLILISVGSTYLHKKRANLNFLDAYLLMVMLYFGVYTIVDVSLNGVQNKDAFFVIFTFCLIFLPVSLTYAIYKKLPLTYKQRLKFNEIVFEWSGINQRIIAIISVLFFAFNSYLFYKFGMITYVGVEIEELGLDIPSWIGPAKVFARYIAFCCYIFLASSIITKKIKVFSFYGLIAFALFFALSLEGRRALIELVIIPYIIMNSVYRRSIFSKKNFLSAIALLIIYLLGSNIFQTYRGELLALSRGPNSGDVTSLINASGNIEATIDNLKERYSMYNFNYNVTSELARDPLNIFFGDLAYQMLLHTIPGFLYKNKPTIAEDQLVADHFHFPQSSTVTDFPTNNFASMLCDFSFLMILFLPILIIFVLFISAYFSSSKYGTLRLFIPISCLQYLLRIEQSYGDIFVLIMYTTTFLIFWILIRSTLLILINSVRPTSMKI